MVWAVDSSNNNLFVKVKNKLSSAYASTIGVYICMLGIFGS